MRRRGLRDLERQVVEQPLPDNETPWRLNSSIWRKRFQVFTITLALIIVLIRIATRGVPSSGSLLPYILLLFSFIVFVNYMISVDADTYRALGAGGIFKLPLDQESRMPTSPRRTFTTRGEISRDSFPTTTHLPASHSHPADDLGFDRELFSRLERLAAEETDAEYV